MPSSSSSSQYEFQDYFVPGYEISRHVIFQHIQYYLGPQASVRPYSFHGREGFLVTAPGKPLTRASPSRFPTRPATDRSPPTLEKSGAAQCGTSAMHVAPGRRNRRCRPTPRFSPIPPFRPLPHPRPPHRPPSTASTNARASSLKSKTSNPSPASTSSKPRSG
jgi:hypothetical protein